MLRQPLTMLVPRARFVCRRAVRRLKQRNPPTNRTAFGAGAEPGPLVTGVFDHIKHMPGWFNVDDCAHFSLVLSMQSAAGLTGDLFEIGSYHGRSTCLLAYQLRASERILVCDTFDAPADHAYWNPPSPERLWENVHLVNPGLPRSSVEIIAGYSRDLRLDASQRFRFAHVDGGHGRETALADLRMCADHLLPGGVIAVDDYHHPVLPDVTLAVDDFLEERPDFAVLADLNRFGASGRKVYLISGPPEALPAAGAGAVAPDPG